MSHYFNSDHSQQLRNTNSHTPCQAAAAAAAPAHVLICGFWFRVTPLNMFFFFCHIVAGFASFPASDSQPKVPRPMSVNPFTVSVFRGVRVFSLGRMSFSPRLSCLSGQRLPQSRDVAKPFHLIPPLYVTHPSISGNPRE